MLHLQLHLLIRQSAFEHAELVLLHSLIVGSAFHRGSKLLVILIELELVAEVVLILRQCIACKLRGIV